MIPLPPPLNTKPPVAFYDTECFPTFWLLRIRTEHGQRYAFELHEGQVFDIPTRQRIYMLFQLFTVVSFNGINYDVPMIGAALQGYTPQQLKYTNDRIIVEKVKYWELGISDWKPTDHIDIMEVAPATGSQKMYAGRIHHKKMQDLPYDPSTILTPEQIREVSLYCDNDLDVLQALYTALLPQIEQRIGLSARYGIDLRSKSDAQLAEAVIKHRCEQAVGRRLYKPEIDWNLRFKYRVPAYIGFQMPQLQRALQLVTEAEFRLGANGAVEMPPELNDLAIKIGNSVYRMGIGGLHSSEKQAVHIADDEYVYRDYDVRSFYPNMILNSGKYPAALSEAFIKIYDQIRIERANAKDLQASLKKQGDTSSPQYIKAMIDNEGGKIMANGTYGKTGSIYSILFAPEMMIQTTMTDQLLLLMLIEWHETYDINVVSANTDGIVVKCPRDKLYISEYLIKEWEKRTGLEMESVDYRAIYSRDINNYIIVKQDGTTKRKGEYATGGLNEKKNPDVEICSDAVAEFLANGTNITETIRACRDIRKFVTIQKVNGGGIKMWGESALKETLVRDTTTRLEDYGWEKEGRKWRNGDVLTDARTAYESTFPPQRAEYLGKVVRWYYGVNSSGAIVYATNGNTVSLSYGAKPCMELPDEFPDDIDYNWYIRKADNMLHDLGYYMLTSSSVV